MSLLLLDPSGPSPVPPLIRPPLPPFPPGGYWRDMLWTPPVHRDFLRADSWGVTLPGMPWVPGASSRHPERVLSWFLDRYSEANQHHYLTAYAGRQYTHLKLSLADSLASPQQPPDRPPGAGQTLAQFTATCRRVKSYGLYTQVVLGSKYFQQQDMNPNQWWAFAYNYLAPLIDAGVVDEVVPGWEWNLWNKEGEWTVETMIRLGNLAHAAGLSCWMHFSPGVTSWERNGDTRGRFGFYQDIGDSINGLNYQGRSEWIPEELQGRLVDTLWWFGTEGNRHKLRLDEDVASLQYEGDVTEDDANLRGYLACCTRDNVRNTDAKVWGYGNGGRRPDGSRL